jgi:hypothetical protein
VRGICAVADALRSSFYVLSSVVLSAFVMAGLYLSHITKAAGGEEKEALEAWKQIKRVTISHLDLVCHVYTQNTPWFHWMDLRPLCRASLKFSMARILSQNGNL